MPAARCAAIAACSDPDEQPSDGGQPHEFVLTSGAFVGSPWAGVPPTGYGARKNSKHSMYVEGIPFPWSMLRQPIHLAPGAIPTWLPAHHRRLRFQPCAYHDHGRRTVALSSRRMNLHQNECYRANYNRDLPSCRSSHDSEASVRYASKGIRYLQRPRRFPVQ